jgi:hypothetical protein
MQVTRTDAMHVSMSASVRFAFSFRVVSPQARQRLRNRRRLTNNSYFESSATSAW